MSLLITLFAACSQEGAEAEILAAPGPAPAALVAPAWAAEGMDVVAYWQGGQLSYDDVTGPMKPQLNQMLAEYMMGRYDAEYQAAQSAMDEHILEAEARAQKLGAVEELLKKEVSDKVAKATEAEIDEAYQMLQRKLRGQPKEEARPTLEAAVGQKKAGERYSAYIAELRGKYKATVQLPFPDVPRLDVSVDDDPSVGPADAPITIIQFAEYQCPYCGKARESLDRVEKEYAGKVRLVFRDFPLDFHPRAVPAAVAANCAGKQEKYWPVHDAIMKDQQSLAEADLLAIAKAAGLDIASWEECRKDPAMEAEVQKDLDDGRKVGVSGTPAFFINGIFISGAQPFEKFKAIIDAELKRKG